MADRVGGFTIDDIIALESGELDFEDTVEVFQRLVNSGVVWQLQGWYGRTAQSMIDAGLIIDPHEFEEV